MNNNDHSLDSLAYLAESLQFDKYGRHIYHYEVTKKVMKYTGKDIEDCRIEEAAKYILETIEYLEKEIEAKPVKYFVPEDSNLVTHRDIYLKRLDSPIEVYINKLRKEIG